MRPGRRSRPLADRFWEKVDKTGDCWVWTGATDALTGYGFIRNEGNTRTVKAHRVSWELHFGPIPQGLWVLHHCDIRLCVMPDHLFLGTHADNMTDMHGKGRGVLPPRGERHHLARLTETQVREIRSRHTTGESPALLARTFGVSEGAVHALLARRSWKHVT